MLNVLLHLFVKANELLLELGFIPSAAHQRSSNIHSVASITRPSHLGIVNAFVTCEARRLFPSLFLQFVWTLRYYFSVLQSCRNIQTHINRDVREAMPQQSQSSSVPTTKQPPLYPLPSRVISQLQATIPHPSCMDTTKKSHNLMTLSFHSP